jgi:hypothetical protein
MAAARIACRLMACAAVGLPRPPVYDWFKEGFDAAADPRTLRLLSVNRLRGYWRRRDVLMKVRLGDTQQLPLHPDGLGLMV